MPHAASGLAVGDVHAEVVAMFLYGKQRLCGIRLACRGCVVLLVSD